jgi:hypothetical protein
VLDWIVRDTIARNTEATLRTLKARLEPATDDGAREVVGLLRRPAFVSVIAVFFAVAATFSLVVGGALVAPRSPLAVVWRMKPQAQLDFASLGALGVVLMLLLAVALLAVHRVSDAVRGLTIEPRAASAIPVVVVAALLLFLARQNVRLWCALARAARVLRRESRGASRATLP